MRYFVRIGEREHEIALDGESVSVDGETLRAGIDNVPGTPVRLVSIGTEVHRVVVGRGEAKGEYDLSVDGFRFQVVALDERTRTIRELAGASAKAAGPAHLMAPMPGLIVRVNVGEGDQVRAGQGLVVMEAMKMENELRASAAGIVRRIAVTPGSAVEKGALLLEMGPEEKD